MVNTVKMKKWSIYILGLALFISPLTYPNIRYLDIGIHAGIYFIVAMGLTVLLGYAGQISIIREKALYSGVEFHTHHPQQFNRSLILLPPLKA